MKYNELYNIAGTAVLMILITAILLGIDRIFYHV